MSRLMARRPVDAAGKSGGLQDVAARAWTLAVARAGQDELGLPFDLREVVVERRGLAELGELLPDPALICVLDEGAGQALGFAVLDAGLTAGVVEALTTGRVAATAEGGARRPTRTDAAMLAPLLDRALHGFEAVLDGMEDAPGLPRGYRFATLADGARGLLLLLEDGPYRLLRARAVLAGGARDGVLMLGLPERVVAAPARLAAPPQDDGFAAAFAAQVEASPACLDAVLVRLALPLGEVLALSPGQEVALPRADIARIGLEGLDGQCVGLGALGRQGGFRAVRLAPIGGGG